MTKAQCEVCKDWPGSLQVDWEPRGGGTRAQVQLSLWPVWVGTGVKWTALCGAEEENYPRKYSRQRDRQSHRSML